MKIFRKIISLFDDVGMQYIVIFFLAFIPLYPKFPAIDIHDTYISIRLEDFLTVFMVVIYTFQIARGKLKIPKNYLFIFGLFWLSVFVSYIWNAFFMINIEYPNIGLLHALRRVQYMVPFFIAYSTVVDLFRKNKNHNTVLGIFIKPMLLIVFLVSLYALGQKSSALFQPIRNALENIYMNAPHVIIKNIAYFFFRFFDFPAVQTMNAEFAKGHLLNLTPESRVSSTFAGHYDLATYLVFFIPIVTAVLLSKKHIWLGWATYILSIMTLILTASRSSFGAYIFSMSLYLIYFRKWRMFVVTILITASLMALSNDMTQRFKDMFQKKRVFQNVMTGALIIDQDASTDTLPAGSQFILEGAATKVKLNDDDTASLKDQLVKNELEEAKKSGTNISQDEALALVEKKYSALESFVAKDVIAGDTSLATRTQIEWPRAIYAFIKNPLLGGGVSSITESTDGDYFRLIGEVGLIAGFLFIFIIVHITKKMVILSRYDKSVSFISAGFVAGVLAICFNAILIDVFEASKVAFVFWTIAGIMVAIADQKDLHGTRASVDFHSS
jgi:hypothetical protein